MKNRNIRTQSVVGEHTVVTEGNRTRVFLGDTRMENVVDAYDLEHIGRYSRSHGSTARHVGEYPEQYTMDRRERVLEIYKNDVEFVRAGLIYEEKGARKLAVNYGFPIEDLEEALNVGRQKDNEKNKNSTGLRRWVMEWKSTLLAVGLPLLLPLASEISGFSKVAMDDRFGFDMLSYMFGACVGQGVLVILDKRKRKRILKKAKER